jgi:hypothetical protein
LLLSLTTSADLPEAYFLTAGLVTRLRAHRNYARLLRSASLTLTPKRA